MQLEGSIDLWVKGFWFRWILCCGKPSWSALDQSWGSRQKMRQDKNGTVILKELVNRRQLSLMFFLRDRALILLVDYERHCAWHCWPAQTYSAIAGRNASAHGVKGKGDQYAIWTNCTKIGFGTTRMLTVWCITASRIPPAKREAYFSDGTVSRRITKCRFDDERACRHHRAIARYQGSAPYISITQEDISTNCFRQSLMNAEASWQTPRL